MDGRRNYSMPPKKTISKSNKPSLFDILSNVSVDKKDNWFNYSSVYNSYMITKYISMDFSLVEIADLANKFDSGITKQMQYDFYRNVLPKGKRYFKYIKKQMDDDIELVAEYYKINIQHAKNYIKILTSMQIEEIRDAKNHIKNQDW
jgi:predicted DNA-binding protein YlxM (UPF0122 family)